MFYHDIHSPLDRFIQHHEYVKYLQYNDFYEFNEIGCGGYGTAYTVKHKDYQQTVVIKRFKCFDKTPELFISEVSNNSNW